MKKKHIICLTVLILFAAVTHLFQASGENMAYGGAPSIIEFTGIQFAFLGMDVFELETRNRMLLYVCKSLRPVSVILLAAYIIRLCGKRKE